ncbi:MAG TPA: PilZ domain-containing protein [Gemmataceae bacterium]|nr:PilZ domain-containing protein [Gemmataceae bacterium]
MTAPTTTESTSPPANSGVRRMLASPRLQAERQRRVVNAAVKELIRQYKHSHASEERRRQGRVDFLQTVKVRLENNRELTVLSRDLSVDGIRLVGTSSLLGQKIQVIMPQPDQKESLNLRVRILWTCAVGDGLFENGGSFLEVVEGEG